MKKALPTIPPILPPLLLQSRQCRCRSWNAGIQFAAQAVGLLNQCHHHFLLSFRAAQGVKQEMLCRFVVAVFFSEAHMRFLLGHKSLAEPFLHRYLAAFDETAQGWQHTLHACQRLLQLLDALRLMVGERTEDLLLSARVRREDGRLPFKISRR